MTPSLATAVASRPSGARRRHHPARRRAGALALVAALVLAVTACEPAHPVLLGYWNAADDAAAWLEADAAAHGGGYTAGNEADLIFALAATQGSEAVARDALDRLEAKTPTYVKPAPTFTNYGGLAKVMLAVQTLRGDVHDFAGLDLEAMLRAGMLTSGPNAGRFTNTTTFTQPMAIAALHRTTGGVPPLAGQWLAAQQCPDGGFSWGACTQVDADHTGIVAQSLGIASQADALDDAIGWLLEHQRADGGFHASNSPADSNTNSTGLAVAALRSSPGTHDPFVVREAVLAGAEYVRSVQYPSGADAGAIPWKAGDPGSIFLATTQGVFAWGMANMHTLAFPKVVGQPCPGETGVTVVVDLTYFNNTINVACAAGPQADGWLALEHAGFRLGSVPGFEGQAICTINERPSEGYPTCWYQGFWSYWHSSSGDPTQWEFSTFGAANRTPPEGSVEGWRYEPDLANHWADAPRISPVFG